VKCWPSQVLMWVLAGRQLYRVYFVWKQYAWYLIPLPLWMLANWGEPDLLTEIKFNL
jgi:hypothetical protein